MSLEREADRYARELETKGVTVVPVPMDIVDQITDLFEHVVDELQVVDVGKGCLGDGTIVDAKILGTFGCVGPSKNFSFHVGYQAGKEKGNDWNRYVNSANLETVEEIMDIGNADETMESFLEPVLHRLWGDDAQLCTLNAQFIVGKSKLSPDAHKDFHSDDAISLLMPVYDYSPENASLYYWPYDENEDAYANHDWTELGRRTYSYQRGEAVIITGNIYHQTVPFHMPEEGFDGVPCRALFCYVQAATNRLVESPDYEEIKDRIVGPFHGHLVDPETLEWQDLYGKDEDENRSKCSIM